MKTYKITVNGIAYEVEVEEIVPEKVIEEVKRPVSTMVTPPKAVAPKAEPKPVGGQVVIAPLPGKIIAVKKQVGMAVDAGEVVMVLEAMKMENEIVAPISGVIQQLITKEGDAVVANGQLFVVA